MVENAGSAITLPDVAAALGVSTRSLQNGFRQWRNTTPHEFLRETRLRLIRHELSHSVEDIDVTTLALRHGFTKTSGRRDRGRGLSARAIKADIERASPP
jgi:transcriptional regulator GlxA family with amidase domain